MPGGMITIDARNTYAAAIFMSAAAKTIFGSDNQPDIAKDGQRKWSAEVAVTYLTEPGRKAVSEVISISVLGADPAATIQPGSPVEFDGLKCGVSSPEKRDNGRIAGGRLFYMATAIRAGSPVNGRSPAMAGKSES